jgi:hypothetical protein
LQNEVCEVIKILKYLMQDPYRKMLMNEKKVAYLPVSGPVPAGLRIRLENAALSVSIAVQEK